MQKVNIYKHYQLYEDGRCYSLRSERFLSPTKSQHGVWRYAFTINRKATTRSIAILLHTYFGNFDSREHKIKYKDKNDYKSARVLTVKEYNKENHNKTPEGLRTECLSI